MPNYNAVEIEKKWQKYWEENQTYKFNPNLDKPKYYNLVMFPYPSGDKLHIGHWYNYAPTDTWGRYKLLNGFNVFQPFGYDSFGLPAENYAIKTGIHPEQTTDVNIETMTRQMKEMGCIYDWDYSLATSKPEYYKWTQWLFLQLYKAGLAYKKEAPVNWCPKDQTVLANEQVQEGKCERCKTEVTKKNLSQWFFKIRDYAEKLLDFEGLDWPEKTKLMQQNWIGRSEGTELFFQLAGDFNFVLLHGFRGNSNGVFFPWLCSELKKRGLKYTILDLPNSENPNEQETINYILNNAQFNQKTVLFGHSLGAVHALKVVEKLNAPIAMLVLAGGFIEPNFKDEKKRPFVDSYNWDFDFNKIKSNTKFIRVLSAVEDYAIPLTQGQLLREKLNAEIWEVNPTEPHFTGKIEPEILQGILPGFKVFTTRVDTIFSCAFAVLAPEHPLIPLVTTPEQLNSINLYLEQTKHKTDLERTSETAEKTGVFTGSMVLNPANNQLIPLWIADFVLAHYGTGAVFGDAHDERDFKMAKRYNIPLKISVLPSLASPLNNPETINKINAFEQCFSEDGILVNSEQFTGQTSAEARKNITNWLFEKYLARFKINYKLKDWLISRQRYWGTPIPIVYDEKGKAHPVDESELPVLLPRDIDFIPKGDGKSPLNTSPTFREFKKDNQTWTREVDTIDTFIDSSWYFLRFPCANLNDQPFDSNLVNKLLPVDMYVGGSEHACMHLLYARFIHRFLYDKGLVSHKEPFKKLFHQGFITKNGNKMSKSKGNVVSPDLYIHKYGADIFRMYLMFLGPFSEGGDWNDQGISGIVRFVERFFTFMTTETLVSELDKMQRIIHKTISKITFDIERFNFNTCISAFMEALNNLQTTGIDLEHKKILTILIFPFAPHLAEEIWQKLGHTESILKQAKWPTANPTFLTETEITLPIQINGKTRATIKISPDQSEEEILTLAKSQSTIARYLENATIKKSIYIKNKLLNLVL